MKYLVTQKNTDLRILERSLSEPRILKRLVPTFQHQPVMGVHCYGFFGFDAEEALVKAAGFEKSAMDYMSVLEHYAESCGVQIRNWSRSVYSSTKLHLHRRALPSARYSNSKASDNPVNC